jgi:hypothetical protein
MVLSLPYVVFLNLRLLFAKFLFCRAIEDTSSVAKTGTDRATKARRQRIEIDGRDHWFTRSAQVVTAHRRNGGSIDRSGASRQSGPPVRWR